MEVKAKVLEVKAKVTKHLESALTPEELSMIVNQKQVEILMSQKCKSMSLSPGGFHKFVIS